MQVQANQGFLNYDQISNGGQMPVQRENLHKSNIQSRKHTGANNSKLNSATRNAHANHNQTPGKGSKKIIGNSQLRQNKKSSELAQRAAFDNSARNISKVSVSSANRGPNRKTGDSSFIRLQQKGANDPAGHNTIVPAAGANQFSTMNKKSQLSNREVGSLRTKAAGNVG